MYQERMKDLIEKVRTIPPKHFYMGSWVSHAELMISFENLLQVVKRGTDGNCGTTGCVGGFMPAWYPNEWAYRPGDCWRPIILIGSQNSDPFADMAEWLGITFKQASYCFDPCQYGPSVPRPLTKEMVIARMKEVLCGSVT